jgi:hypothetical protein
VLALYADGARAVLHETSFIDGEDASEITQMFNDTGAQVITDRIGVPGGPTKQVLQGTGIESPIVPTSCQLFSVPTGLSDPLR